MVSVAANCAAQCVAIGLRHKSIALALSVCTIVSLSQACASFIAPCFGINHILKAIQAAPVAFSLSKLESNLYIALL